MNDKIYEVIKEIETHDIKNELVKIKEQIKQNDISIKLINEFNNAKVLFEKYDYNKEIIESKLKLMKDPLIKRYLEIQNEINMISLYINKKIEEITKNTI